MKWPMIFPFRLTFDLSSMSLRMSNALVPFHVANSLGVVDA